MPITVSLVTSGTAQVDAAPMTAAFTPDQNQLYLLAVLSRRAASEPATPTASGAGLTWTAIDNQGYPVAVVQKLTVFRALGAGPSNGALTIDFADEPQEDVAWQVLRVTGVSPSHASQGVVQSAKNSTSAAASLTVTLAAFGSANNGTIGFFGIGAGAVAVTPGTGFTELGETTVGSVTLQSQWRNDNDTTVDATFALNAAGGIALEIALGTVSAATIGGGGFFPGGAPGYISHSE